MNMTGGCRLTNFDIAVQLRVFLLLVLKYFTVRLYTSHTTMVNGGTRNVNGIRSFDMMIVIKVCEEWKMNF